MEKARILVQGIVQGVGFRPTVYRIAKDLNLNGYVRNLGNIVEIILEGSEEDIKGFVKNLKSNKPPISRINSLQKGLHNTHHPTCDDLETIRVGLLAGSPVF